MCSRFNESFSLVWIITLLVFESSGTIIGRYFNRVYLSSVSAYSQHLLETKSNVKNKMLCGTYCLQYKCQCAAFVYDSKIKTCNMFSQKLVTTYGGIIGYTKNTGCALTIPSVTNGNLLSYSTCSVSFSCPTGYKPVGVKTIQCQDNEEWDKVDTSCDQITCIQPEKTLPGVVIPEIPSYLKASNGITIGSKSVYDYEALCYERVCQADGTWSDLKLKGPLPCLI